jgi:hypothetical protein
MWLVARAADEAHAGAAGPAPDGLDLVSGTVQAAAQAAAGAGVTQNRSYRRTGGVLGRQAYELAVAAAPRPVALPPRRLPSPAASPSPHPMRRGISLRHLGVMQLQSEEEAEVRASSASSSSDGDIGDFLGGIDSEEDGEVPVQLNTTKSPPVRPGPKAASASLPQRGTYSKEDFNLTDTSEEEEHHLHGHDDHHASIEQLERMAERSAVMKKERHADRQQLLARVSEMEASAREKDAMVSKLERKAQQLEHELAAARQAAAEDVARQMAAAAAAQEEERLQKLLSKCVRRMGHLRQGAAFCRWLDCTRQQALLKRFLAHLMHAHLAAALNRWQEYTEWSVRSVAVVQKVLARWQQRELASTLRRWYLWASETAACRRSERAAAAASALEEKMASMEAAHMSQVETLQAEAAAMAEAERAARASELKVAHSEVVKLHRELAHHEFTETALRSKIERRDEAIKALKKVMTERDERWRQRLLPHLEAHFDDDG